MQLMAEKHTNEHHVVHDYGLWAMVKTSDVGDLNANVWYNLYLN